MVHVLWTVTILKCPYIPKVFKYKSSENVYNKFICKKIFTLPRPPKSAFMHSQSIKKIFYSGKSTISITFNEERKQKYDCKTKERGMGGGGGGKHCVHVIFTCYKVYTIITEYLFNMHKPPFGRKSL